MRRIGELWHKGKITVDIEHYCTSVTQTAMAQLYPLIFEAKRKNKSILCACPGTELHEMGARMVADIFEEDFRKSKLLSVVRLSKIQISCGNSGRWIFTQKMQEICLNRPI